ncbi:MAG: hypothetical protein WA055_05170 [Candidatus Moraniibacteriota bacterium]
MAIKIGAMNGIAKIIKNGGTSTGYFSQIQSIAAIHKKRDAKKIKPNIIIEMLKEIEIKTNNTSNQKREMKQSESNIVFFVVSFIGGVPF